MNQQQAATVYNDLLELLYGAQCDLDQLKVGTQQRENKLTEIQKIKQQLEETEQLLH